MHLSQHCARSQGEPKPHGCSAGVCECPCHAVAPPADFRAQVEAAKAEQGDGK
jgi:hypothetical protein